MSVDFPKDYLATIAAVQALADALVPIGMGGCRELDALRAAVVKHGAETHADIQKNWSAVPFDVGTKVRLYENAPRADYPSNCFGAVGVVEELSESRRDFRAVNFPGVCKVWCTVSHLTEVKS